MELGENKSEKGIVPLSKKSSFLFLVLLLIFSFSFLTIVCTKCPHLVNKDGRRMRMRTNAYIEDNYGRKIIRRRLSAGPGSYPPRCTYKCGRCTPCNPVHVPVPPGTMFFPTEYYPEAWRCKCGNRLYMP